MDRGRKRRGDASEKRQKGIGAPFGVEVFGDEAGQARVEPLPPETERVMHEIIGAAISVHRRLGPGFLESIYRKAMSIELAHCGLQYATESPVRVRYRDIDIAGQRADLIVEGRVIVELKAIVRLDDIHRAQVISYLKATGLRAGLLLNFRVNMMKDGIQRIVL